MLVGMLPSVAQQLLQILFFASRKSMHSFFVCTTNQTSLCCYTNIAGRFSYGSHHKKKVRRKLSQLTNHGKVPRAASGHSCQRKVVLNLAEICQICHKSIVAWHQVLKGVIRSLPQQYFHKQALTRKLSQGACHNKPVATNISTQPTPNTLSSAGCGDFCAECS